MADHAVEAEIFYGGSWHDVTVYDRDGVSIARGAGAEGQDAPPTSITLAFEGTVNPKDPTSALYGSAGRNTPVRVSADGSVRAAGEVASWAPGRTLGVTRFVEWTSLEGAGVLRRLGRSSSRTPLRSPAFRALSSPVNDADRLAYWAVEETAGATSVSTAYDQQATPGIVAPVSFGADENSASSERFAVLGVGGSVYFFPPVYTPGNETKIICLFRIPAAGVPDGATIMRIWCTGGTLTHFDLVWTSGNGLRLHVWAVNTLVQTWGPFAWDPWIGGGAEFFQSLEFTQDGADLDILQLILRVDNGINSLPTTTVVGHTLGRVTAITMGMTDSNGLAFGQLAVASSTTAFANYISPINDALGMQGFAGERAGRRFLRLCEEENVPGTVVGDPDDTQRMGAQDTDQVMALLRECVRTDDGMLFETRDDLELAFRTGRDRYNQAPALTLDFAGGQLAPGIAPMLDDKDTRNDITVKRRNGGTAQAVQTSGPLNVNPPVDDPDGVGRYDVAIDVNPQYDSDLPDLASWLLSVGTHDEARYPGITVDLDAAPGLIAAVNAVDIGDRIIVENLPMKWQAGDASLLVRGIRENFPAGAGDFRRLVTFVTVPARPYEVAIVGALAGGVDLRGQAVDTDSTVLGGAGATLTSTSLSFVSTNGVVWTTRSSDWNPTINGTASAEFGGGLFIIIGGEVMRISNVTGASSPQTVTVVRAVNGVSKTHAAGSPVHVYHPARVGL